MMASTMALTARTLEGVGGALVHRVIRLPKSWWYGLSAGLVSGILQIMWDLLIDSNQMNYRVFATMNPVLQVILAWGIVLAPVVLIVAAGVHLGYRSGRVRDGLVAGVVGGGVYATVGGLFLLVYTIIYAFAVTAPTVVFTPTGTRFTGRLLAPAIIVGYDIVLGAICSGVGAGLGALGAFVARRWYRREQEPWHASAGLAISAVSPIPAGSLAMTLGDEQPREAGRGRESQAQGVAAVATVLKGAYEQLQAKRRNLAMRFSSSTAPRRGFFGLPQSVSYGLSAGLFSGLLWALYAGVVRLYGPIPANAGLLSQVIIPGLLLLPAFVVLAIGLRLGWHNGSVLDGLIAGMIASIVLTMMYSLTRFVVMWGQMLAEAHADHLPLWFELLAAVIIDILGGAMFLFLGIGLGSLGALVGLLWRRREQLAWRKYVALVAAKIAPFPMFKKPIEELRG